MKPLEETAVHLAFQARITCRLTPYPLFGWPLFGDVGSYMYIAIKLGTFKERLWYEPAGTQTEKRAYHPKPRRAEG